MPAPLIWLAVYLSVGAAVLWACYNTSSCLLHSRMERNRRITSGMFSSAVDRRAKDPKALSDGGYVP